MSVSSKLPPVTALKLAWVWRSPKRSASIFYAFAKAEQASMMDMEAAATFTSSPERAAAYLQHASEENHHARMFYGRAQKMRAEEHEEPFAPLHVDTEHLFQKLGEEGFLAFVHHGEKRALKDFEIYIQYFSVKGRSKDRALLERIIVDEKRHASYTFEFLVALCGTENKARAAIRKVQFWEFRRAWMRHGRWWSEKLYVAATSLLFITMAPLSLWVRVVRPLQARWRVPKEEL